MRAESIMIAPVAFPFYLFARLQPVQLDQCNVKVKKKGDDILQLCCCCTLFFTKESTSVA
jgi:hypothetical protein